MKTFFILGLLCFANPNAPEGVTCVSFWEEDKTIYSSPTACYNAAQQKGDEIVAEFRQNDIEIVDYVMWCVRTKDKIT